MSIFWISQRASLPLLGFTLSIVVSSPALAGGPFNGPVTGKFSNPKLTGFVLEPSGPPTFFNNTSSYVYSPSNLAPSASVTWGDNLGSSFLSFTPNPNFNNVPSNTEALLGTISYGNGTSALNTLIFGLDLTINIPGATPLPVNIPISTTVNTGDPAFDADFIQIEGLPTLTTLHAYEGQTVMAQLFGKIVGDPEIQLTALTNVSGGGFIGSGPVPVPEPSSVFGLIAFGTLGAGLMAFRKKIDQ